MAVKKRSIALDEEVALAVEEEARAAGVSVSAWLTEAAREKLWETRADRATAEQMRIMGLDEAEALAVGTRFLQKHGIIPKSKPRRRGKTAR
jgi:hypothetical protein